jgi:hypothetical protein
MVGKSSRNKNAYKMPGSHGRSSLRSSGVLWQGTRDAMRVKVAPHASYVINIHQPCRPISLCVPSVVNRLERA